MGYPIERVNKAYLKVVTDTYIDYKKRPNTQQFNNQQFYFAMIDPKDYDKEHFKNLMSKLRRAIKGNRPVNLILERREGKPNKKQKMDYLVLAEFY